jgi:hypothetical protein
MAYKDPNDPRARESRRKHYYKNKQQYYDRNQKKIAQLRQYVLDIKNSSSCADCDNSFPDEPWLLEFDHVKDKSNTVQYFVQNGSIRLLKEEIEKCDLVCVLCHRRRTALRGNWVDNRLAHLLQ